MRYLNQTLITFEIFLKDSKWESPFLIIQKSPEISQTYSEPSQVSKMEIFTKTVNSIKPLSIFAKCTILDI